MMSVTHGHRLRAWLALVGVVGYGAWAAPAPAGLRTWQAPARLAVAPILDGRVDEPAWQQALQITDFRLLGSGAPSPELPATRALLAYDREALYLAFVCQEPLASQLITRTSAHDGPTWSDDSVEVFLDPAGTRQGFVQLAVNAHGVIMDGIQTLDKGALDRAWETGARAAASIEAQQWSVEIAVPFAGLPLADPAAVWTFHLARNRRAAGQHLTALGAAVVGFGEVAKFDRLAGLDLHERGLEIVAVDPGEGYQGTNLARVRVRNRTAAAAATLGVELARQAEGTVVPAARRELTIAAGAEATLEIPWERPLTPPPGAETLTLRVLHGDLLLAQRVWGFAPPPPALGAPARRVHLLHPHAPVPLSLPVRLAAASRRNAVLEWQAFDAEGQQVGDGLVTVRTAEAVLRLYWNRWLPGRYTLRFSLRSAAGSTTLATADTPLRLVRSPWGE